MTLQNHDLSCTGRHGRGGCNPRLSCTEFEGRAAYVFFLLAFWAFVLVSVLSVRFLRTVRFRGAVMGILIAICASISSPVLVRFLLVLKP